MLTLNVEVNVDELVAQAQKDLKAWLEKKNDEFLTKLMEVGRAVAERSFGSAAQVRIEKRNANTYALIAEGEAVCFIEFGTGAYANPGEDGLAQYMPFDIRPGSWSDSEFGAGTWSQYLEDHPDDPNGLNYPLNRRPKYGMWNAYKEMDKEAQRIAKEVYR